MIFDLNADETEIVLAIQNMQENEYITIFRNRNDLKWVTKTIRKKKRFFETIDKTSKVD